MTPEVIDTRRLSVFLRVYGVIMVVLFTFLFISFMVEAPFLAENGGSLNWLIWNDVRFGHDHAHVPPMLFVIFVVWGVFLLRTARNPRAYSSFLDFTIWASVAHGLLMIGQVATELERYWSKFLTDIPFFLIQAIGIVLLRPREKSVA